MKIIDGQSYVVFETQSSPDSLFTPERSLEQVFEEYGPYLDSSNDNSWRLIDRIYAEQVHKRKHGEQNNEESYTRKYIIEDERSFDPSTGQMKYTIYNKDDARARLLAYLIYRTVFDIIRETNQRCFK